MQVPKHYKAHVEERVKREYRDKVANLLNFKETKNEVDDCI